MSKHSNNIRYEFLDFTRGIAIGLMFIFHLSFGLTQLGYFQINFSTDIFWNSFRSLIVFLFLSLVGIGLYLATRNRFNIKSYLKRLLLLLLYLSLITLLSKTVRPDYYVFFGILHLIFVSSILGLLFVRFYWLSLLAGLACIVVGNTISSHLFDGTYIRWIGLSNQHYATDDYAPILPWFGIVLIGIFIGRFLFTEKKYSSLYQWNAQHWITRLVCWAGRYSIHLYFVHFQLFYVFVYLFG